MEEAEEAEEAEEMEEMGGEDMAEIVNGRAPGGSAHPTRKRYFGSFLCELRESYSERMAKHAEGPLALRAYPTAKTLIACMQQEGYSISNAAYSEIENGLNVPRDGAAFIKAVAHCLQLTEAEVRELALRLAYDLISPRMGTDWADVIVADAAPWNR